MRADVARLMDKAPGPRFRGAPAEGHPSTIQIVATNSGGKAQRKRKDKVDASPRGTMQSPYPDSNCH